MCGCASGWVRVFEACMFLSILLLITINEINLCVVLCSCFVVQRLLCQSDELYGDSQRMNGAHTHIKREYSNLLSSKFSNKILFVVLPRLPPPSHTRKMWSHCICAYKLFPFPCNTRHTHTHSHPQKHGLVTGKFGCCRLALRWHTNTHTHIQTYTPTPRKKMKKKINKIQWKLLVRLYGNMDDCV